MYFENISDANELVRLFNCDPAALENLSEEELHVIINFLIENSDDENCEECRLLDKCLELLEKFDGYSDDTDNEKILADIFSSLNAAIVNRRTAAVRRFFFAAAILTVGAIFIIPANANSRIKHFRFNFDETESVSVSDAAAPDASYTLPEKFWEDYPHIMYPAYITEEFSFMRADIFSEDNITFIAVYFCSDSDSIIKYTVRNAESVKSLFPMNIDPGSCASTNYNGTSYYTAARGGNPFVVFKSDDNQLYSLNAADSVLSEDELMKIAFSFE